MPGKLNEAKELIAKAEVAKTLIYKKYPEKEKHIRKVSALWGPYYRVNFIHEDTGYITTSTFIKIKGDTVTEE